MEKQGVWVPMSHTAFHGRSPREAAPIPTSKCKYTAPSIKAWGLLLPLHLTYNHVCQWNKPCSVSSRTPSEDARLYRCSCRSSNKEECNLQVAGTNPPISYINSCPVKAVQIVKTLYSDDREKLVSCSDANVPPAFFHPSQHF